VADLRKAARGRPCELRLHGVCRHDLETTVLAHIRRANTAGVGQKPPDVCAVIACEACHAVLDGRAGSVRASDGDILDGLLRTLATWSREGLL